MTARSFQKAVQRIRPSLLLCRRMKVAHNLHALSATTQSAFRAPPRRFFSGSGIHPDFQTSYKTGDIEQVKKQIETDVKENDIFLFMKGTPAMPQCGFSKTLITVLTYLEVEFNTRDVLSHPALRQAVKEYSDWPTFPQLWYKGELVGGHDIVVDMFKNGELQQLFGIEEEEEEKGTQDSDSSQQTDDGNK